MSSEITIDGSYFEWGSNRLSSDMSSGMDYIESVFSRKVVDTSEGEILFSDDIRDEVFAELRFFHLIFNKDMTTDKIVAFIGTLTRKQQGEISERLQGSNEEIEPEQEDTVGVDSNIF